MRRRSLWHGLSSWSPSPISRRSLSADKAQAWNARRRGRGSCTARRIAQLQRRRAKSSDGACRIASRRRAVARVARAAVAGRTRTPVVRRARRRGLERRRLNHGEKALDAAAVASIRCGLRGAGSARTRLGRGTANRQSAAGAGIGAPDLWAPDCWREQTENRRKRRKQLEAILAPLAGSSRKAPLILGGDFNAPPGDAIFRLLSPLARDAFVEAGRGWGNTIVNQFPVLRIDQIWIDGRLQATDAYAVATQHSDHRAVVCDLRLE